MSKPIRKLFQLLGLIERGRFDEAADEALAKAIETLEALPKQQGKAVIVMTIEISCQKEMINVLPKIQLKLPEDKAFSGTPFWIADGELSTQHPNQLDMLGEPREVRGAPTEPARERA